jgi:hypothetical protein
MITTQAAIELIGLVVSVGFVYGTLNTRLKQLEKYDNNEIRDRLARIEEQFKILLDHFIKKQ